ncbi:MAG: nucleotide sugar dehydrogenase [Candidatus Marinamargulisbacteria bacterium]
MTIDTNLVDFTTLKTNIESKQFTLGVVGLGYVGLPLACEFIQSGVPVVGLDVSTQKIDALKNSTSYIQDISNQTVSECMASGQFTPTTDFSALAKVDVISICVPTPLRKTKDPDMSFVVSAVNAIAEHVRHGQLIILESTTYPGTTEELLKPIFEDRGHVIGTTLYLAFSPERVDPGNPTYTTKNTPKIVGGVTDHCTQLACATYAHAIDTTVPVSSPRAAELVKLYENTFRSVNIAMANEMALISNKLGIDVWEVIDAAATKPFGFMPFYPGPGLGGHCIPIDPSYLSWKMKSLNYDARFVGLAEQINTNMPNYVVQKISTALNTHQKAVNGSRILILGVAYKPNINDVRESPALDIINELIQLGADVTYNDDYIPSISLGKINRTLTTTPMTDTSLSHVDAVVIVTNHDTYDIPAIVDAATCVIDTRNATKGLTADHIVKL